MAESIECPACRTDVAIRDPRPGRFRVACPTCGATLFLDVPAAPVEPITVAVEPAAPAGADTGLASPVRRADAIRPGWLGRYRVLGGDVGRLGRVGPPVALSVVRERWAADPRFVAAWALEALAAAELRHPNLLAPIGLDHDGDRVFAAEPVGPGLPLSDPSARGELDRQGRVGAVLHAARGLRVAHEQGVYHRGLDLNALQVDRDGLVVVAGLGVGLTPTSAAAPVAPVPVAAPGDPASPPPILAPIPDARADVAGLGRVFSTLLAGASGDRAVPPGLASLARRMVGETAAGPIDDGERFADMGAVVRALEAELGLGGPLVPPDAEADACAAAMAEYQAAPLVRVRRWWPFHGSVLPVVGLMGLVQLFEGSILGVLGWLVFGALAVGGRAGLAAWEARGQPGPRVARVLAVLTWQDLGAIGITAVLGVGALVLAHLAIPTVLIATLGVGLAAVAHFGLDRPLAQQRAEALGQLRGLIRGWRRLGVDEVAIRRYVNGAAGREWEEAYGELFGFDAIAPARARWRQDVFSRLRPRFARLRTWGLARVDGWVDRRAAERTRALLEPILERDLEARGLHVLTARRKARRAAEAVVGLLAQYRHASDETVGLPLAPALRRAVDSPEDFLASPEIAEAAATCRGVAVGAMLGAIFGPRIRFVLGAAALAGSVVWMERNELINYDEAKQAARAGALEGDRTQALATVDGMKQRFVAGMARVVAAPEKEEVMRLGVVDFELSRHLNGFALLASALILIASSLVRGPWIVPFALGGALIPLTPRLVVPDAGPLGPAALAAMALGAGIFAVGVVTNRDRGSDG